MYLSSFNSYRSGMYIGIDQARRSDYEIEHGIQKPLPNFNALVLNIVKYDEVWRPNCYRSKPHSLEKAWKETDNCCAALLYMNAYLYAFKWLQLISKIDCFIWWQSVDKMCKLECFKRSDTSNSLRGEFSSFLGSWTLSWKRIFKAIDHCLKISNLE